jgi:hypothetical protein
MGENFKNLADTAQIQGHKLVKYINMDPREFNSLEKNVREQNWWKVLSIDQPPSFEGRNHVKSLDTLVSVYRLSKWLESSNSVWLRKLIMDGQVICSACFKKDSVLGAIACRKDKIERHLDTSKHKANVEEYDVSQPKIDKIGGGAGIGGNTYVDKIKLDDKRRYEALVVGTLAAGGDGAAGIPPSSIHQHFCKDILDIVGYELRGGIPTSDTIIKTTLPNAIECIEGRIKDLIKDTPIALYIDGGSASHLALGRKVMVLCASSMKWEGNVLLDVHVMEGSEHETIDSNVKQILAACAKYDIPFKNVQYLCADNGSTNKPTVDKLNEMKGFNVTYARCLPHCLNLVIKSFLNVMDRTFKFTSHLKLARQFLTAGGGVARKLLAIEFGFAAHKIDLTETRWASVVNAILYVANFPTKFNTTQSIIRLKELAAKGDATAQAALDDSPPEREIWFILFDLFQSVSLEQLEKESKRRIDAGSDVTSADMALPKARQLLLHYFTQTKNFLAFQAMQFLFGGNAETGTESLKTIFTITQGNPCFEAKLTSKDTGVVPDCVSATTQLLATLKNLHYPWKSLAHKVSDDFASEVAKGDSPILTKKKNVIDARKRFYEDQEKRMKRYLDATIEYYKHLGINIFSENEAFDAAVAEKWRVDQMQIYTNTTAGIIMAAVHEGIRAIQDAEGLKKTEECLEGLKLSQVFNVNKKPPKPSDDDSKLLHYIGGVGHKHADSLMEQWREYVTEWEKTKLTPPEVYKYWEDKSEQWNILGPHAMREFSRPVSSAACERVFSLLEGMNREDRCKMQAPTLAKLLFLRGNADIMRAALRDANALRMQAAQAKAAQEQAASTSEWKASKATNVQTVAGEIVVDDEGPVASRKGRKRLRRMGEDVESEEEKKKQRLERNAKNNEMWDALKIKEKEEEERKKREREEKRKNSGIS